jgi:hypothetical protein
MNTTLAQKASNDELAFALGGLAGNNAHGAGFLQAALDHNVRPALMSCTSGQIFWVYRYLLASQDPTRNLADFLKKDIEETERFHQPDADLAYLALQGKPGVFRLASSEMLFDTWKNSLAAYVNMIQNWGHNFYLREFFNIFPARTMVPLFSTEFFEELSNTINDSDIGILFNSYSPSQGMEFVHLNSTAKKRLGLKPGSKKSFRDRTLYKDVTPRAIQNGLWIYQYGFDEQAEAIDGAYYRQIILSELKDATHIFVARPLSFKWIGSPPNTFIELEDMKTEINFNGSYEGERDKIKLINEMIRGKVFKDEIMEKKRYHHIDLIEIEIDTQQSFFDYIFEKMETFESARRRTARAFQERLKHVP